MSKLLYQEKLNKIKKVFDLNEIIKSPTDSKTVAKYYRINILAYSLIYRENDFIHMALTPPRSKYNRKKDVLNQVKIVENYINKSTENILELATGRGANSYFLAKKYPKINFFGLDLPNGQIKFAHEKSKKVNNFNAIDGDFHNLKRFKNNNFDLIFIFEALCYSDNKRRVFEEVNRILKKDGLFIIIDAFTNNKLLTDEEKTVKQLIEKGMAVPEFEELNIFEKIINSSKFKVIKKEDLSIQIIPSLERLEKYSNYFFRFPIIIQKIIIKIFPKLFIYNTVSGYLMKDAIENKLAKYFLYILKKS